MKPKNIGTEAHEKQNREKNERLLEGVMSPRITYETTALKFQSYLKLLNVSFFKNLNIGSVRSVAHAVISIVNTSGSVRVASYK